MAKKSTQARISGSKERTIRVEVAVLALGASVLAGTAIAGLKQDIEDARGATMVDMPFGRARSYFDSIELMVIRKGIRTQGQKLIEWNDAEGVMRMSQFGKIVLKKLEARIRQRLGACYTQKDSGLILGVGG